MMIVRMRYAGKKSSLILYFKWVKLLVLIVVVVLSFGALISNAYIISQWKSTNYKEEMIFSAVIEGILENLYDSINKEINLVNFLAQNHEDCGRHLNQIEDVLQHGQFVFINNTGQVFYNFNDFYLGINHLKAINSFIVKNIATEHQLAHYHIKVQNSRSEEFGYMLYTIPITPLIARIHQVLSRVENEHAFFMLDKNYNEIYNSSARKITKYSRSCSKISSPFSDDLYLCSLRNKSIYSMLLAFNGTFLILICGAIFLLYFLINKAESISSFASGGNAGTQKRNNFLHTCNQKTDVKNLDTLSHVTHELRTPLSVIIAFSEIMKNEDLGPMYNKDYLNHSKEIYTFGTELLLKVDNTIKSTKLNDQT